ncbi:MAG: hypothetical protein ACYC3H_01275 [Bellilinea sp.]
MSKKNADELSARIEVMDVGLDKAVIRIISHYFEPRPISRGSLLVAVAQLGHKISDEKEVRDSIHRLRRMGFLICARSGNNGGYYMARSLKEYERFELKELTSKISDMSETRSIMREAARAQFGDGYQLGLPQV